MSESVSLPNDKRVECIARVEGSAGLFKLSAWSTPTPRWCAHGQGGSRSRNGTLANNLITNLPVPTGLALQGLINHGPHSLLKTFSNKCTGDPNHEAFATRFQPNRIFEPCVEVVARHLELESSKNCGPDFPGRRGGRGQRGTPSRYWARNPGTGSCLVIFVATLPHGAKAGSRVPGDDLGRISRGLPKRQTGLPSYGGFRGG